MSAFPDRPATDTFTLIDDCWNRIGVRGDASCEKLAQHIDCRNCPVHARAAAELLDRLPADAIYSSWDDGLENPQKSADDLVSLLLFRIGEEWLALPTALFEEITECRTVHSLPHRRNAIVLGITNLRGALVTCISLAAVLGIARDDSAKHAARQQQRMLVLKRHGQATAFTADEVHGTLRVASSAQRAAPTTLARAAGHFTHAIINWNDRSVGLLDEELVFHTLDRGLA